MATPCDSELAQAPFETYRDPKTGEWRLESHKNAAEEIGKIIPFRRQKTALKPDHRQAK